MTVHALGSSIDIYLNWVHDRGTGNVSVEAVTQSIEIVKEAHYYTRNPVPVHIRY